MPRCIRLLVAFDGGGYQGWQRQLQGPTVQGELERRLATLCRHPVTVHGAGRTDAGVHTLGMVAHFHTERTMPLIAFFKGLNALLPADIRILHAAEAPTGFHSRFDAWGKTYRYDFCTAEVQLPSTRLYEAHRPGPFDPELIAQPLAVLVGTHDFSSFERSGSRDRTATHGRGAARTLYRVDCLPQPGRADCWSIRFTGDGFLRQMVRILSGTLIEMGQGKRSAMDMKAILAARDRSRAGPAAPACGLFLEEIYYHNPFTGSPPPT
ncbi:MAG: tRNA pseudouridine(38-40) synthase TruA [Desulfobulbus sp.]|jgi:tRNA pseudouridine38-40 synthase|nr:tRNA pseudouridine(38-40) synthase TruA [Desulfobulbus sp.]